MKKTLAEISATNPTFVGWAGHNTPPLVRLFTNATRTESGCLIPLKKAATSGYVQVRVDGVLRAAHRYVFEQLVGILRKGQEVMHSCDVPACIEPTHLEAGTHSENMKACVARGRHRSRGTLTLSEVARIYSYPASEAITAQELGVGPWVVRGIRSGRRYRSLVQKARSMGYRRTKLAPGRRR